MRSLNAKELIGEDHDKSLGLIFHSLALCTLSLDCQQGVLDKKDFEDNKEILLLICDLALTQKQEVLNLFEKLYQFEA